MTMALRPRDRQGRGQAASDLACRGWTEESPSTAHRAEPGDSPSASMSSNRPRCHLRVAVEKLGEQVTRRRGSPAAERALARDDPDIDQPAQPATRRSPAAHGPVRRMPTKKYCSTSSRCRAAPVSNSPTRSTAGVAAQTVSFPSRQRQRRCSPISCKHPGTAGLPGRRGRRPIY